MIVDPDFFDHWKTRLLVDLLDGDELAPLYVMRIWAHCQARKKADCFAISAPGLRALCRCVTVDGAHLERGLIEAGFIERHGEYISVTDWAERNKKLVTAWKNGATGGRGNAKKQTEPEPNGNPNGTETEPNANPTQTEREAIRSREEVDKNKEQSQKLKPARTAQPTATALLMAEGVSEQTAADWIAHRKAKRASASATVIEDRKRVCAEVGISLADGLALEMSRGWQGLQADWVRNALGEAVAGNRRQHAPPYQTANDRAREWVSGLFGGNDDDGRIIDITPAPSLGD